MDVGSAGRPDGEIELRASGLTIHRAAGIEKNELKPWLKEQWCIPPPQSAEFVWRMEDVLDVYQRPYDPDCPVVCLDEKSRQLLSEVREPLPAMPGAPAREDYEYRRGGTANVFVAFEPLADWRKFEVTARRTKRDWANFVQELLDGRYRKARKVALVMDNLNTHSPASLYEAFGPAEAKRLADRLEIHHTPKHGSWLNMAEIEISVLSRQLPRRIADASALHAACRVAETERNKRRIGADWRFTTTDARIKLKRLYPSAEEQ